MNTNLLARPARPHRALRGAAVALAVTPMLALAACSGEAPITNATATTQPATGPAPTSTETDKPHG